MNRQRLLNALLLAAVSFLAIEIVVVGLRSPAPAVASSQFPAVGAIVDSPSINIAGAPVNSAYTPTTGASSARIIWNFGTVSGTYSGCTAQAQTTYDGANFVSLGAAAPLTVASNTLNQWSIFELPLTAAVQNPADISGISVTPVSAGTVPGTLVASSFGELTRFSFSCTSYGTSAPVTVTVIYR